MSLVDDLIEEGWLKTPRIIQAFRNIKRKDFLPQDSKDLAELNTALPIGWGQTISQPLVVAFMLEELEPESGEKILDVGAGSGWTSALLADIVGQKGKVIAVEIVPELMEFGKKNVSKYNFLAQHRNKVSGAGIEKGIVEFVCADGSKGYPNISSRPELAEGFDKILAGATAGRIPPAWKEQLKIGGRIVAPVGTSIFVLTKKGDKNFEEIEHPGFVFVPLIEK